MNSLIKILEKYIKYVFMSSNRFTTVETIKFRMLQQCAKILCIDITSYIDKNLIHVHKTNMDKFDKKWQTLLENGVNISHDNYNTYKIIKSSDFLHILDIKKFVRFFIKKNEINFINELLAVDGFKNLNAENYIENLKYDKDNNHVFVIREIYRNMDVSVEMLHLALLYIYEKFDNQILQARKKKFEKQIEFKQVTLSNIIEYYTDNIQNLEDIANAKIAEIKLTSKINCKVDCKRNILKEDHKERSYKKIKVNFID